MANNQVIVIQVKDKDNNEDRYFNQSDILPDVLIETGSINGFKTLTTFHVHRSILQKSSSIFGNICDMNQDGDIKTIQLLGSDPNIFHHLVFDMYGGMVSSNILRDHATAIIETADRFGVEKLKMKAEEMYLEQNAITFDNIMDTLLYSDAKNCTIIKAAVMDCLVRLSDTAFVQELSFKDMPGHLMKDLLTAVVRIEGEFAKKIKVLDERQEKEFAEMRARQLETEERIEANEAERLSWQREQSLINAEHSERINQNKKGIAYLKKFTRAKYCKAIVLSFLVGVLSTLTIGYVFACVM